jgi:hypothetical protein
MARWTIARWTMARWTIARGTMARGTIATVTIGTETMSGATIAGPMAHDPVDGLVDGSVAAEHDHKLAAGRLGQFAGVAAVPGMFDVEVDQPAE